MTRGMRINPEPVTRAEFAQLLNKREALREHLRQLDIGVTIAKARGVEPVTRENVTNEITMSFERRLTHTADPRDGETIEAIRAWHRHQDGAALDRVIAALNAETKP